MAQHPPSDDQRHDSLSVEPPVFEDAPPNALTPMGQLESLGAFARGLGARRMKVALGIGSAVVLLLALLATIA